MQLQFRPKPGRQLDVDISGMDELRGFTVSNVCVISEDVASQRADGTLFLCTTKKKLRATSSRPSFSLRLLHASMRMHLGLCL